MNRSKHTRRTARWSRLRRRARTRALCAWLRPLIGYPLGAHDDRVDVLLVSMPPRHMMTAHVSTPPLIYLHEVPASVPRAFGPIPDGRRDFVDEIEGSPRKCWLEG